MKRILLFFTLLAFVFQVEGQSIIRANPYHKNTAVAVTFCDEYQDIYDVMTTPPTGDTATWQNTMVKAFVDGGYWTGRMELFYVFATRLRADALRNWVTIGSYDLTDPGTTVPAFVKYQGFTGDGSSDYFSTGYIPATNATNIAQNSTTLAVYCRLDDEGTVSAIGVEGAANQLKLRPHISTGDSQSSYLNAAGAMTLAGAANQGLGFSMVTRRGAAETEGYSNGSSLGSDTDASTGLPADDFVAILANNDDTVLEEFTDTQIAIVLVMNAVSDADATAINTIIETYMDAIGTGVEP